MSTRTNPVRACLATQASTEGLPEIMPGRKTRAVRPMLGQLRFRAQYARCVAVSAGGPPPGQQIAQSHATARFAPPDADLVAAREREEQEPRMLEGNAYRFM